MNQGIQTDLDSGYGGTSWTVSSALATHSSFEEVTKSRSEGPSSGGTGTGTVNVGTQTANLQVVMAGQGAATGTAVHSTYLYDSRAVSDTTRDTIQVRKSSAFS